MECFVIMPISEPENSNYETGHFSRVYQNIIIPACKKADFNPVRSDDINEAECIAISILKRIQSAEMAICDISTKNANVMYELGLRHALYKPVTIIKDNMTDDIFDIYSIRSVVYNVSLRCDFVEKAIDEIAENLKNTHASPDSPQSVMYHLNRDLPEGDSASVEDTTTVDERNHTHSGIVAKWFSDNQRGTIFDGNEDFYVDQRYLVHTEPLKEGQRAFFVPQERLHAGMKHRAATCVIGIGNNVEAVIRYANHIKFFCYAEVVDSLGNRRRVHVAIPHEEASQYREGTKIRFIAGETQKGLTGLDSVPISE